MKFSTSMLHITSPSQKIFLVSCMAGINVIGAECHFVINICKKLQSIYWLIPWSIAPTIKSERFMPEICSYLSIL